MALRLARSAMVGSTRGLGGSVGADVRMGKIEGITKGTIGGTIEVIIEVSTGAKEERRSNSLEGGKLSLRLRQLVEMLVLLAERRLKL